MRVKSISQIAEKYSSVTPQRAQAYVEGVQTTPKDWAQATAAAEANFEQGIQKAIQNKSFARGVKLAGTQKQKEGVARHGLARFQAGTADAGPAYTAGFQPYHDELSRLTLPARFARRDPRNLERVRAIMIALGRKKVAAG